jgi:hypothetical protein
MAAMLVSVEGASAGVAAQEGRCAGSFCSGVVTYTGDPGENNVLTLRAADTPRETLLFDAGAAIRGCPAFEGGVRCVNPSGVVYAHLGDGDDQATGASQVWGGTGNDRLTSASRASGGPGDDVITEARTIYDDDGDQPGNDLYVGSAPPVDSVSSDARAELYYGSRSKPVRLDLRPGRPSEDRVSNIPKIFGTRGADVLIGDDGPNELNGGGGRDVVRGLGGDDVLIGDSVDGGDGDDTLDGGALGGRVRCGPGRDVVMARPRPRVAADCEAIRVGDEDGVGPLLRLHLRMPRTTSAFLSGIKKNCDCDRPERWTATAGGTVLASLVASRRPSALRLNAAGRRLLRRSGRLPVRVEFRVKRKYQPVVRIRFRLDLRVAA